MRQLLVSKRRDQSRIATRAPIIIIIIYYRDDYRRVHPFALQWSMAIRCTCTRYDDRPRAVAASTCHMQAVATPLFLSPLRARACASTASYACMCVSLNGLLFDLGSGQGRISPPPLEFFRSPRLINASNVTRLRHWHRVTCPNVSLISEKVSSTFFSSNYIICRVYYCL